MALFASFFRDYFGMRHYVLHSPLSAEQCSRRLRERTCDPLGRSTGAFVGWVWDDGFRLGKVAYGRTVPTFYATPQAWGVFLEGTHGTEIRLDIGTRRSELIVALVVGMAAFCAIEIYALTNGLMGLARGWPFAASLLSIAYVVSLTIFGAPGYLHAEISETLRASERVLKAGTRPRRLHRRLNGR